MAIGNWFFRLAVFYLVLGVALGIVMAATGDHSMHPVHAHLNLLGWVTLGLFGAFYKFFPTAEQTRMAKAHFWLYVPAHFVMMIALAALYRGNAAMEPILGVTSSIVGLAILCFGVVVWKHTAAGKTEAQWNELRTA